MAYAALVSLSQTLHQFLLRHQHYFSALHENQHIQSLHDKIVFLSTFLEDFPREAGQLEARMTVAANQVEDIFEYHILEEHGSKYAKLRSNVLILFPRADPSPLDSLFSALKLKKLYKELRKPIKEIDSILNEAMEIKGRRTSENEMIMPTHSYATFSSTLAPNVNSHVVGFEKELLEIKERLFGESAKLEVITIVGMRGIGKTTLARYALHDPSTLHHFDVSAFVFVSQNYDKTTILLCLLNSIDPSSKGQFEGMSFESLLQRVYQYLIGRRFLIVIDDMWNTETWDDLRRVFPDDSNGSRIIITTTKVDVASYADTSSHSYEMHLMSVDLSWNLLRQKVFDQDHCPPELEEIGREIAEECGGLPLAIVVIAGVLSKLDRMQHSWKKIARNVKEAANTSEEPFAEILSLSYTCLPHHLRPCFLYLAAFPEDYEIHVSNLTRVWVAEGFLKSDGSKDLEDVAEDYLEELAKRSLVMINKKRYNGKLKSIKMHNLLRKLCLRKADDEKFLRECSGRSQNGIEISRRLSILGEIGGRFKDKKKSPIHTILVFYSWYSSVSWKYCRLLRVLCPRHIDLAREADQIGKLLHLRYLAIISEPNKKSYLNEVPKSFSKLVNLQTLIINGSMFSSVIRLPLGIWKMRELRQIIILDGLLPDPLADQIYPLDKLHTLKRIRGLRFSQRVLEFIPNLKKLGIIYSLDDKTKWPMYGLKNLVHLQELENLNLFAYTHDYSQSDLSKSLAFPVTLKKLTLSGTEIPLKDMSIVGSLPNLQMLKLKYHACRGFKWETIQGQFCQLKVLVIDDFRDLEDWITENGHFPRLEQLILHRCDNLREIPNDIGDIATLQLIEVDSCKSSVVESAKDIEEEQHSYGNYIQLRLLNTRW